MKEIKVQIPENVKEILAKGRVEDYIYFLPQVQLDRTEYTEVNKILELLGGKWNRSKRGHIFPSEQEAEAVLFSLEKGEVVDKKKTYQFFETPAEIADRMVELADIRDGMTVLEPSAGHGAIAEAIVRYDGALDIALIMVEVDPEKAKILEGKKIANVLCEDFMGTFAEEYGKFDRILMNPPFTKEQDADHILHAYENCLYPEGKLVAIASASVTFNSQKKYVKLRELIEKHGTIEDLPESSFKESGTNVNTVLITLTNPPLNH